MHSSRMCTARSLTISPYLVVSHIHPHWSNHAHPPEQPCMPPQSNHACPLSPEQPRMPPPQEQPRMPPRATMHAPHSNHARPPRSNHGTAPPPAEQHARPPNLFYSHVVLVKILPKNRFLSQTEDLGPLPS